MLFGAKPTGEIGGGPNRVLNLGMPGPGWRPPGLAPRERPVRGRAFGHLRCGAKGRCGGGAGGAGAEPVGGAGHRRVGWFETPCFNHLLRWCPFNNIFTFSTSLPRVDPCFALTTYCLNNLLASILKWVKVWFFKAKPTAGGKTGPGNTPPGVPGAGVAISLGYSWAAFYDTKGICVVVFRYLCFHHAGKWV